MHSEVGRILDCYEAGRFTRREVVARLAALVATAGGGARLAAAQAEPSTFAAVGLNHIALRVSDVARSRDFYVQHLGLSVMREALPGSAFLDCGPHFVALFRGERPGLDHYCYSVPGYDQSQAAAKLKAVGIQPRLSGSRIYFDDPDGIEVQLAAPASRA